MLIRVTVLVRFLFKIVFDFINFFVDRPRHDRRNKAHCRAHVQQTLPLEQQKKNRKHYKEDYQTRDLIQPQFIGDATNRKTKTTSTPHM